MGKWGCVEGQAHIGHLPAVIGGQSMRDAFGGGYASANMQDSLYDPGADGKCLSRAQVGLCFSSSELYTSQPSHLSGSCFWYHQFSP